MQLRHLQTLLQAAEPTGPNKITAICWAPNSKKLAVVGTDRVVTLFDDMGERRDKFSTKPADKVRGRSTMPWMQSSAMHVYHWVSK